MVVGDQRAAGIESAVERAMSSSTRSGLFHLPRKSSDGAVLPLKVE